MNYYKFSIAFVVYIFSTQRTNGFCLTACKQKLQL